MSDYNTIRFDLDGKIARITFCRPEVHNAFNSDMIRELTELFLKLKDNKELRVVVLTGQGKSYCAGADLNWMRSVVNYSYEQNLKESLELAALFRLIYEFPLPVIGMINGAAIGGGTGFVAVTDIAIAADTAIFSFSEVKIGVVPACISPYVVKRVGEGKAREFFLTGERLTAARALEAGLVNSSVPADQLEAEVEKMIQQILSSGPDAIGVCKELLHKIADMDMDTCEKYTAEVIANLRKSPEGQEGMDAFLNKRKPKWVE